MAYAFVADIAAYSTASASSIAVTLGTNPTAGNLLYVASDCYNIASVTHTDSLGNTWVEIGNQVEAGIPYRLFHAYSKNITGGADTVTATFNAANVNRGIYVMEISGLDTASPFVDSAEVTDTGGNPTTTATCTNTGTAGVLMSVGLDAQTGTMITVGSGMTSRQTNVWPWNGGNGGCVQYKATAADSNNYTSNFVNTDWSRTIQVAAIFKESSGGGGGALHYQRTIGGGGNRIIGGI